MVSRPLPLVPAPLDQLACRLRSRSDIGGAPNQIMHFEGRPTHDGT